MSEEAYVTIALCDNEAIGAMVLANSLKQSGIVRKTCVLIDNVSGKIVQAMTKLFDCVKQIHLDKSAEELIQIRPDIKETILKLQCWRLIEFKKCVYLDPACFVLKDGSDLFKREELSASPDTNWPDHFNSGVFVFCPNDDTYAKLIDKSQSPNLIDVSFQGILNNFFDKWATEDIAKHLPFIYNVTPNVFYTYQPASKSFQNNVRIVQLSQEPKPWNTCLDVGSGQVYKVSNEQQQFYSKWWNQFNIHVKPLLDEANMQCVKVSEQIHIIPYEEDILPNHTRTLENIPNQHLWESGQIDYMGKDSFDNIQKMLDKSINE